MTSPAPGTSAVQDFVQTLGEVLKLGAGKLYPIKDNSIPQDTMRSSLEQFVDLCQGSPANYADVRFKIERDASGEVILTVVRGENQKLSAIIPFIRGSFPPKATTLRDLQLMNHAMCCLRESALHSYNKKSEEKTNLSEALNDPEYESLYEDYNKSHQYYSHIHSSYLAIFRQQITSDKMLNALDQFRIECQTSPEACGDVKICLKMDANNYPVLVVTREKKEKGLPVKDIFFLIRTVSNRLLPELRFIIENALIYLKDRPSNEDEIREYEALSASISTK